MKPRAPRFQSCNVLAATPAGRRLWQFGVGRDRLTPAGDLHLEAGKPLPKRTATKDWQTLLRPRLDLAWLPPGHVFVRAIQLPAGDPAELPGMVEFQLEKISPLPVNQIVWSVESLPHPDGAQQTALVTIASRDRVEAFLAEQAANGYIVDGLDVPLLRELRELKPAADGVWIIADDRAEGAQALVGWFRDGVWRDVALFQLPAGDAAATTLVACLNQTAWAGEMEGWLDTLPEVRLHAGSEFAARVAEPLATWSGRELRVEPRQAPEALAAATARRRLQAEATALVPPEVSSRQRAQWVDRLWLRGLTGVLMAYLFCVFLYLIALNVRKYQLDELKGNAVGLGRQYTNSLQLKAQIAVLDQQIGLKFAALDSWLAVVDHLPETLTLSQLDFQKGQTLELNGTVASESTADVTKFNTELGRVQVRGEPLFAKVNAAQITARPGSPTATWRFTAELRREQTP